MYPLKRAVFEQLMFKIITNQLGSVENFPKFPVCSYFFFHNNIGMNSYAVNNTAINNLVLTFMLTLAVFRVLGLNKFLRNCI